jgi:predicted ATPase
MAKAIELQLLGSAAAGAVLAALLVRRWYDAPQVDTSHSLDPHLLAASRPRTRTRRSAPRMVKGAESDRLSRVVRVVLTGGPCGAKSSCLSHLMRTACADGYDVLVVPEIATLLFNGGVRLPRCEADNVNFQSQLMRVQLASERAFTSIAERTGRPTIIVMDRGLLDGKGYVETPDMWTQIVARHGVDDRYLLNRYDAIVHLVTSADGAEQYYKQGHVTDDDGRAVFRAESADQARALDAKMRGRCWSGHAQHIVIHNNFGSFQAKMEAATAAVMAVARRLQPAEAPEARPRVDQPSPFHDDDMPGVPRRVP